MFGDLESCGAKKALVALRGFILPLYVIFLEYLKI